MSILQHFSVPLKGTLINTCCERPILYIVDFSEHLSTCTMDPCVLWCTFLITWRSLYTTFETEKFKTVRIRTVLKLSVIRFLKITAERIGLKKWPLYGNSLKNANRTVQKIKTVFRFIWSANRTVSKNQTVFDLLQKKNGKRLRFWNGTVYGQVEV